jgi:carbonic anhydrase
MDMATSPTQRSLQRLRQMGYRASVVEHWNPHAKCRQDLFGFVDILAVHQNETLAVQTTSSDNVAARVRKIRDSAALEAVLQAGWRVQVHGWRKRGTRWECRVIDIE